MIVRTATFERTDDGTGEKRYTPSRTEVLLEDVCASFGTTLLPAQVGGTATALPLMVRVSEPVVVTRKDGKHSVVQLQHTRFSPLAGPDDERERFLNLYNAHPPRGVRKRAKRPSIDQVLADTTRLHDGTYSGLDAMTDSHYHGVRLHRWGKGIYMAVFDGSDVSALPSPFRIHEPGPVDLENKTQLPLAHLSLTRSAHFAPHGRRESTKGFTDTLHICYPQMGDDHMGLTGIAVDVHPLGEAKPVNLIAPGRYRHFGETLELPSDMSPTRMVGFMQAYVRRYTQGRTL